MTKTVEIEKSERAIFWQRIKQIQGKSWDRLAEDLGISRPTIFNYKSDRTRIQYGIFLKLCELGRIKPSKLNFRIVSRTKAINNLILNEPLSEFIGIVCGDGHLDGLNYEINITGHAIQDKKYLESYVVPLAEKLFGISPSLKSQDEFTVIRFRLYSKELYEILNNRFSIPSGKKTKKLKIIPEIRKNRKLLIRFLRGLFDTDGSIYTHHGNDMMLEISAKGKMFRRDIMSALIFLGFHPFHGMKNIVLYRQSEIVDFFKLIKPKNDNHLRRFLELKRKRR